MPNTSQVASPRELTDSLLHTNKKRVAVGAFSGLIAGLVMLGLTTLFTQPGSPKLWWLQLTASVFYGGEAFAIDAAPNVLLAGLAVHFAVALLCGIIMGKLTVTKSFSKLFTYGLVLGGLCWLATNMFGPDFLMPQALDVVSQWLRMFLYLSFTTTLASLLWVLGRSV